MLATRRAGRAAGVRTRPGGSPRWKGVEEKGWVAAPVSARAEREVGEGRGRDPRVQKEEGRLYPQGWGVWALESVLRVSGGKGGLRRGKRSHELQVRRALTCRLGTQSRGHLRLGRLGASGC